MSSTFFTILIDNKPTRFEKQRVISIEPYEFGTKVIIEASHSEEEPIVYFTKEAYDEVYKSYLS